MRYRRCFTLVELLVVVAIIALLAGMLLPVLSRARHQAWRTTCVNHLRQFGQVLTAYADEWDTRYPLEPTEHNPHPGLLDQLELAPEDELVNVFYCPRGDFMEQYARNPYLYVPNTGDAASIDSVIDTPANRLAGNFTYIYWSFAANKPGWRNSPPFRPRQLRTIGAVALPGGPEPVPAGPDERWVASDFFRQKAPFPHARGHAQGLNVAFLDGHVSLVTGRPQDNYR